MSDQYGKIVVRGGKRFREVEGTALPGDTFYLFMKVDGYPMETRLFPLDDDSDSVRTFYAAADTSATKFALDSNGQFFGSTAKAKCEACGAVDLKPEYQFCPMCGRRFINE